MSKTQDIKRRAAQTVTRNKPERRIGRLEAMGESAGERIGGKRSRSARIGAAIGETADLAAMNPGAGNPYPGTESIRDVAGAVYRRTKPARMKIGKILGGLSGADARERERRADLERREKRRKKESTERKRMLTPAPFASYEAAQDYEKKRNEEQASQARPKKPSRKRQFRDKVRDLGPRDNKNENLGTDTKRLDNPRFSPPKR